ncbi:MAG: urea ABC transporter ATP-binding subunit UrtE [Thalassobaculaceae bacterium]
MLEVRDVNLFYGAAQALKNVSLTAARGQVTCVLGRNGVGKTSLMRAITGRQVNRDGQIVWDGQDMTTWPDHARARHGMAIVPQGREIFPLLTVAENLRTGLAAAPPGKRRVSDEIFELFPVLASMLNRRGGDLSGGQQQQLAIGRALVTQPRLLILDEPTEGIQPSIIQDIGRAITYLRERGDMAIVLVEQYFDFAYALGDNFVVMDRGEVVLTGAADTLGEAQIRRYLTV